MIMTKTTIRWLETMIGYTVFLWSTPHQNNLFLFDPARHSRQHLQTAMLAARALDSCTPTVAVVRRQLFLSGLHDRQSSHPTLFSVIAHQTSIENCLVLCKQPHVRIT